MRAGFVFFVTLVALTACKKEDPPPAPTPPVASASAAASAQEAPFDRTMFRDGGLGGRRHRFRVNDAGGVDVAE